MNYYNSTIIARKKKVQVSFDVLHALIILSFQVMHFMDNDSGRKKTPFQNVDTERTFRLKVHI